ncbi:MAG: hypothetical protein OER88_11720, partial [Planctomycetota bacterium]|nr:hypothetical protein [Planctomycetota bacterium]
MHRVALFSLLVLAPALAQDLKFAADRPLDLTHVRLDVSVDLKTKTVAGTARLDLVALRDTDVVSLDARRLRIREVLVLRGNPLQPAKHASAYDGERLELTLDQELARNEPLRVEVTYACVEPDRGLYFFGP